MKKSKASSCENFKSSDTFRYNSFSRLRVVFVCVSYMKIYLASQLESTWNKTYNITIIHPLFMKK